jgi:hypothetical protein
MNFSHFSKLPKAYSVPLRVIGIAALGLVFFGVVGYLVMWLWNHVLVSVLALPSITFWQGLGLFVLAKLFFGFGAGAQGGGTRHDKKRHERETVASDEQVPDTDLFKRYWRDEGKQAYEAYLAGRDSTGDSNDRT